MILHVEILKIEKHVGALSKDIEQFLFCHWLYTLYTHIHIRARVQTQTMYYRAHKPKTYTLMVDHVVDYEHRNAENIFVRTK